jgi:dipeptidyl-peptidase 4
MFRLAMWTSSLLLLFCGGTMWLTEAKSIELKAEKSSIRFDDVIPSKFGQRGFSGSWISSSEFTFNSNGDFIKFNVATGQNDTILSEKFIGEHAWNGTRFSVSSDLKKVLVRHSERQIFRHSTVSRFSIIRLDGEDEYKVASGSEIQIAFFTPNGKGLAFIENNDIYYLDIPDNGDYSTPQKITTDGIPGVVSE